MSSILHTTLNTRALPTDDFRYIRSDYPGNLSDSEIVWLLEKNITTIVDLREEKEYIAMPCRLENEEGFKYYPSFRMRRISRWSWNLFEY